MSEKWVQYNEHDELVRAMVQIDRLTAEVERLQKRLDEINNSTWDQVEALRSET